MGVALHVGAVADNVFPTFGAPRTTGGANAFGDTTDGGASEQLPVSVTSPTRVNGPRLVELTSSWNVAPHAGAVLSVPVNPRRTFGCRPAADRGPHWISLVVPSGWPGTQRAVISPTVAPPTKVVPAGPTR